MSAVINLSPMRSATGARILRVSDNEDAREMYAHVPAREGFRVHAVLDGVRDSTARRLHSDAQMDSRARAAAAKRLVAADNVYCEKPCLPETLMEAIIRVATQNRHEGSMLAHGTTSVRLPPIPATSEACSSERWLYSSPWLLMCVQRMAESASGLSDQLSHPVSAGA